MAKFTGTLLPQTNDPTEIQKGHLDLLAKINQSDTDAQAGISQAQEAAASDLAAFIKSQIGVMDMWPAANPPDWGLICDGRAVGRIQYASLYAVIGDTWGAGDGSTTFNLPDMTAAAPKGVGTSTKFITNETVTLGQIIDDQIMDHGHLVTDPGHTHRRRLADFMGAGTARHSDDPNVPFGIDGTYLEASVTGITIDDTSAQRTTPAIRKGTSTITKSIGINYVIRFR